MNNEHEIEGASFGFPANPSWVCNGCKAVDFGFSKEAWLRVHMDKAYPEGGMIEACFCVKCNKKFCNDICAKKSPCKSVLKSSEEDSKLWDELEKLE